MLNLYTVVIDTGRTTTERLPVRARSLDEAMDQGIEILKIPYEKVVSITAWEANDGKVA